jgi:hypothetical protein
VNGCDCCHQRHDSIVGMTYEWVQSCETQVDMLASLPCVPTGCSNIDSCDPTRELLDGSFTPEPTNSD